MEIRKVDFAEAPFLVIWEMTRACALRCVHCRASSVEARDPRELSTGQAMALLDEIRRFGQPLVVLTGGDPLRRPDAAAIVRHGTAIGLRMAMTPSGTSETTHDKIRRLKKSGLARLAVSLDAADAETHDAFRQVKGSFGWTRDILRWAKEEGLSLQINTTVTKPTYAQLDGIASLLPELGVSLWSVFFLVPMGRGALGDVVRAADFERAFLKLYEIAGSSPFGIKTTEAQHYRRFVIQRRHGPGARPAEVSFLTNGSSDTASIRSETGVNDGKGFVFVSHTGEVFPSGFLPLSAGNVKTDSLVELYRDSPLFRDLRDSSKLKGKCGACEFKDVCGGSRARAYAVHGDPLAAEPFCAYVPKGYRPAVEEMLFW